MNACMRKCAMYSAFSLHCLHSFESCFEVSLMILNIKTYGLLLNRHMKEVFLFAWFFFFFKYTLTKLQYWKNPQKQKAASAYVTEVIH